VFQNKKTFFKYALVACWLLFTVSLAVWWYIFSISQLEQLKELNLAETETLVKHQSMLLWEGLTLIVCLIGGGVALTYYIFREVQRNRKIQEFFLTFSHELKTPLASLRLQAESLQEDLAHMPEHSRLLDRLVADIHRLTMQLENSLFLAHMSETQFCLEKISLQELIKSLAQNWPELKIEVPSNGLIFGDARALQSVSKNIIQNSVQHGKATEIVVSLEEKKKGLIAINFTDNGQGFSGNIRHLGLLFSRPYTGSGSGIGLYLIKNLVKKMGGEARFTPVPGGFQTTISLRGEVA